MTLRTSIAAMALLLTAAGCGGSSSGPGAVLGVASQAGVVAACTNVQTAASDRQAGDDDSAVTALRAAVSALRKPPTDDAAGPAAASIESHLAAGDTSGALTAGTSFCATRGR